MSAREAGIFIEVEVEDGAANDPALSSKLEEVCPVDIFRDAGGRTEVVRKNVDECVLCRLCLEASSPGAVHVRKLYADGAELS